MPLFSCVIDPDKALLLKMLCSVRGEYVKDVLAKAVDKYLYEHRELVSDLKTLKGRAAEAKLEARKVLMHNAEIIQCIDGELAEPNEVEFEP